ncbi:hypothetical protein PMG11_09848 [Penicillium brasilianum]|uniref:Cytochrome P450 n=1 Tax=Penicillium brasilianum TaxID=104259 RepID=A0A0F7U1Y7_PENBI|nr:hypothetical protein PMG11_09848 [Penicillium brasilianum]
MRRRVEYKGERPDFIQGLLQKSEQLSLGVEDLASNAQIFIGAGAESTATLLMGVAYLLLKHDHVYD